MRPVQFGRGVYQPRAKGLRCLPSNRGYQGPEAPRDGLGRFEESYLLPAEEASENDVRAEVRVSLGLGAGGCRRPAAE